MIQINPKSDNKSSILSLSLLLNSLYLKFILPWVAAIATGDKSAYDYLAGTIENFPTKEALAEQLKLAGFNTVEAKGLTFSIVAIHQAIKA